MTEPGTAEQNLNWARQLIAGCVHAGAAGFVVSPGSRSTPLTLAAAEQNAAPMVVHFDERGAAFHALGWAQGAQRPVALLCTSGTAGANYLPAAVEAAQSRVPLLLLTADRPPELQDCGANQTIAQAGLFGRYVRWEHTLPCPDPDIPLRLAASAAGQACHMAVRAPAGPVHLNCPFREPLAPAPETYAAAADIATPPTWHAVETTLLQDDQHALLNQLARVQRGLLLVGRLQSPRETAAARSLAAALGWPVFADLLSGMRLNSGEAPVVAHHDALLDSEVFRDACAPDLVLHIGGRFISKRLPAFLETYAGPYLHVAAHPFREDPAHRTTDRYESDIANFCTWLAFAMRAAEPPAHTDALIKAAAAAGAAAGAWLEEDGTLTEIAVARLVSHNRPPDTPLFLGNSMPVRDMDLFGSANGRGGLAAANRGASGIDGNVATAVGLARGAGLPATAVVGDVALLHDLNSLALLRQAPHPLTLVVLNNNGGGIFHFLPVSALGGVFEPCFAAPHGIEFEAAARMFGIDYVRPESVRDFEKTYFDRTRGRKSTLLEVKSTGEANLQAHQAIRERMVAAAENALRG